MTNTILRIVYYVFKMFLRCIGASSLPFDICSNFFFLPFFFFFFFFDVVSKMLRDQVPKTAMFTMVNKLRLFLEEDLIGALYRECPDTVPSFLPPYLPTSLLLFLLPPFLFFSLSPSLIWCPSYPPLTHTHIYFTPLLL